MFASVIPPPQADRIVCPRCHLCIICHSPPRILLNLTNTFQQLFRSSRNRLSTPPNFEYACGALAERIASHRRKWGAPEGLEASRSFVPQLSVGFARGGARAKNHWSYSGRSRARCSTPSAGRKWNTGTSSGHFNWATQLDSLLADEWVILWDLYSFDRWCRAKESRRAYAKSLAACKMKNTP